jgi:peptidoglycan/xylan/chitin deacetylase (PgdA/CDA1 family)
MVVLSPPLGKGGMLFRNYRIFAMKRLILTLAILLTLVLPGWAATYYVDNTLGKDTYNGTTTVINDGANQGPWKTLAKVNGATFALGDIVLFKSGEVWAETLAPPRSGDATHRMIFGRYGTGRLPEINGGGGTYCLNFSKNYVTFENILFKRGRANFYGNPLIANNCIFGDIGNADSAVYLSMGNLTLNNCLVYNNSSMDAVHAEAGTQTITLNNTIIVGVSSYCFHVCAGATITYTNCFISGNPGTFKNGTGTLTDGGNNLIGMWPYFHQNPYDVPVVISCDDTENSAYALQLATALAPYDAPITFYPYLLIQIQPNWNDCLALIALGSEVGIHTWSHPDLTKTTAFTVTSTNTNPTINIDAAGKQIILSCDEVANRVTLSWSSTPYQIRGLKSAVSGKGWTITTEMPGNDYLRLISLADSGGVQSVTSYAALLNPTAYWTDEIDTPRATFIANGVTPTTLAYPYGKSNANLHNFLTSLAWLKGARGVSSESYLSSTNIFTLPGIPVARNWLGDGTEASVREHARNTYLCNVMRGSVPGILSHRAEDATVEQLTWIVDELSKYGVKFLTMSQLADWIKADHTTVNNINYTKTYPDIADFHLKSPSPCINAGRDVGLATDIEGWPISQHGGYDIGPYTYRSIWRSFLQFLLPR